ncbi:hypothetical protein B296_00018653 [Ensete ventricosum]|uniref:Uncharacterized protein n=1 Tax=Ensete ventricosum TaxID=4639 RepID=A0A426YKX3_ENSVE|nr:hypothetical protein B296_00018653 [Ensete ventricosum]
MRATARAVSDGGDLRGCVEEQRVMAAGVAACYALALLHPNCAAIVTHALAVVALAHRQSPCQGAGAAAFAASVVLAGGTSMGAALMGAPASDRLCRRLAYGRSAYRLPRSQSTPPLQGTLVAANRPLAGGQAMAGHLCKGSGHGQPPHVDNMQVAAPRPQAVPTFAAIHCNKRVEQLYSLQCHHT